MGERTSYAPGTFSWVDLSTTDVEGAKTFYAGLFGWEPQDMPAGEDATYTMFARDGRHVAGMWALDDEQREQGVPPFWLSYVTVEDVDATAARAAELGGRVLAGPFEVLDAGRMAVLQDVQGGVLAVWRARRHVGAGVVNVHGALT